MRRIPGRSVRPVLEELARVVRPGGTVVIVGWSSQEVLPGHAALEARLDATCSAYAPFLAGMRREAHFLRAASAFVEAGFADVAARTFVGDVRSPIRPGERAALASLLEMFGEIPATGISDEDERAFQRLCSPGSEDFILDVPGYYAFFTYTMFRGRVPVRRASSAAGRAATGAGALTS